MSSPKFKDGDLVILIGDAYVRSRRSNLQKPVPEGSIGYVLAVRLLKDALWQLRGTVRYEALVRFDGIGPAIEVEEKDLSLASPLDRLVRET